jgi:hypothetical protein
VLAIVLGEACGSGALSPTPMGAGGASGGAAGGGGSGGTSAGFDAARDATGDAAACGCTLDSNGVLTVSWACYCGQAGCFATKPTCGTTNVKVYAGCDLVVTSLDTAGGPWLWVFDSPGQLVGRQETADVGYYECPSDPSLRGSRIRAGVLPDATCEEAVACSCVDGGGTACAMSDAGADR